MKRYCLLFLGLILGGCVQVCIPKCDNCHPCNTNIISSQYELSSVLDLEKEENTCDETYP